MWCSSMTHVITTVLILITCIAGAIAPAPIYGTGQVLVVDYGVPMFQLNGLVFGGYSSHEFGHHLQQQDMGDEAYYATVVVPSILGNLVWAVSAYILDSPICMVHEYYDFFPWEHDANVRSTKWLTERND